MPGHAASGGSNLLLIAVLCAACGAPKAGPGEASIGATRCVAGEGTVRLPLADWPAAEMASLQSIAERSVVVVGYDGCTLALLDGCHLPGEYLFSETAQAREVVRIATQRQLEERLPLGAAGLKGDLARAGEIRLEHVIRGTLSARISDRSKGMLVGDCDLATHFVHSMITGAYRLDAGGDGGEVLRRGADVALCDSGAAPRDPECGAVVQAVLMPISDMTSDREDLYGTISDTVNVEEAFRALSALAAASQPTDGRPPVAPEPGAEVSARISALPDGGSDAWDEGVKPIMVGAFDRDGSGGIDTAEEVSMIPCDVLHTLDRSIRAGRGGVSALRSTYGFPERYHWVGSALGFDEAIRVVADARLANCGL
jgi:hypothetical protein